MHENTLIQELRAILERHRPSWSIRRWAVEADFRDWFVVRNETGSRIADVYAPFLTSERRWYVASTPTDYAATSAFNEPQRPGGASGRALAMVQAAEIARDLGVKVELTSPGIDRRLAKAVSAVAPGATVVRSGDGHHLVVLGDNTVARIVKRRDHRAVVIGHRTHIVAGRGWRRDAAALIADPECAIA